MRHQEHQEINVNYRTYLIKYAHTIRDGKFITDDLIKTLKKNPPQRGIEYIKVFDEVKHRFVRISKADIETFHSWNTEATEILKKYSIIK